jgi:ATP-binding cassette, subfamily C (CFTR/MRP), member 4
MKTATRTDSRVKFMFSIINGIQIIKMYCWENSFGKIIKAVRKHEIKAIGKSSNIKAALLSFHISTQIAIFLSLVGYVLMGNSITAQKAFVTIAYFNYINHALVDYWPLALTSVAEGIVSVKRVEQFLLHEVKAKGEEKGSKALANQELSLNTLEKALKALNPIGINLKNASAFWSPDGLSKVGIKDVTLTIGKENLTVVIGQVGSGKSTLLEVFLKELPLTTGEMQLSGVISYAAQQSWIFEGSIKSNIIFTNEFDAPRYKSVVHACALERDFELFPHGDETIVGDRGLNLSGGQKARLNLARAIYKTADIYLLDDPLSAVDVNVGNHIFEKCIKDFLKVFAFNSNSKFSFPISFILKDKICVLVTHQLQYLKSVKHIVVMNNGSIQIEGSFDDVKASESFHMLENFEHTTETPGNDESNDDGDKDEVFSHNTNYKTPNPTFCYS